MTQGAYRILGGERELVESYVAAPGPGGWRYFGRVHEAESERELYVVDHVTDLDWRVVRFRLLSPGRELVVERSPHGMHVIGPDEVTEFEGVDLVWSPSPWSLHVARSYLEAGVDGAADAVRVDETSNAARVRIELRRDAGAERGVFVVDGVAKEALFGSDIPVRAEGWFELFGGGAEPA